MGKEYSIDKAKSLDCHGHGVLDIRDTPEYFLGLASWYIHRNLDKRSEQIQRVLNGMSKLLPGDKLRYLSQYLDTMDNTDDERVEYHLQFYDVINVICVDLHFMGAGKCSRRYEEQIESAIRLKKKHNGRVKISMMLDPNRPNLYDLVCRYHKDIDIWKLYPTWYYVTDPRLRRIFNNFPKPVIVHCTNTSPVHWEGSRSELKKKLEHNRDEYKVFRSKKWNCQFFSHPKYVFKMSLMYPNINWSWAHAGGHDNEYRDYILSKLGGNLYADDSFTYTNEVEIKKLVSILPYYENLMHGSDFFMTKVKTDYERQVREYNVGVPKALRKKQLQTGIRFLENKQL